MTWEREWVIPVSNELGQTVFKALISSLQQIIDSLFFNLVIDARELDMPNCGARSLL